MAGSGGAVGRRGRRGRSFEIWIGTRATMGKGSAGVLEKESKKQRMVEIGGRTAIRSSERDRPKRRIHALCPASALSLRG